MSIQGVAIIVRPTLSLTILQCEHVSFNSPAFHVCSDSHLKYFDRICDLWRLGQRANNFALGRGVHFGRQAGNRASAKRSSHPISIPSALLRWREADWPDGAALERTDKAATRVVKVSGSVRRCRLTRSLARLRNVAGASKRAEH